MLFADPFGRQDRHLGTETVLKPSTAFQVRVGPIETARLSEFELWERCWSCQQNEDVALKEGRRGGNSKPLGRKHARGGTASAVCRSWLLSELSSPLQHGTWRQTQARWAKFQRRVYDSETARTLSSHPNVDRMQIAPQGVEDECRL